MRAVRIAACGLLALLLSHGANAMFRAADLVVVPVAGSITGANGSNWFTDIEIFNADPVSNIDVEIVFLPCCSDDNRAWYSTMSNTLGGRSDDGFGHINTNLENIPPGRQVIIQDIISGNWGTGTKGALLVFAYEAGTLMKTTPPGGNPKNIIVNSRSYTLSTDSTGKVSTYGQGVPGLPWYDYIDASKKAQGLNQVTFTGIQESAGWRTDVGYVNVSDPLTELLVRFDLYGADGTKLDEETQDVLPLAVEQWTSAAHSLFQVPTTTDVTNATIVATVDAYFTQAKDPTPAFIVYASKIDNVTNDPIYLEQTYLQPLPFDCIFNGINCPTANVAVALGLQKAPARPRHLLPLTRQTAR